MESYKDANASIEASVEQESKRTGYPEGFPALPEIPAARYYDPAFYALEMEHIWRKTWLNAAHISQLPTPGAYKLFEKFEQSIILSRGTDDVVRAFRNACRHRGAALVTEPTGVARRFICPYHAWGYSTDGELKSVPEAHNFACLDKAERPLRQVRCETWHGFIFINFDDNAESLEDFMAPVERQIRDFPIDDMIVKDEIEVTVDGNWKTSYDNFLEIYHVNTVHAKSLAPYLESKSFTVQLLKNGHARFVTRRRQGQSFFAATAGADGAAPADFTTRFREHAVGLPFFPNGFTALDPVGFSWQRFWPAGPGKSVITSTMMGWKRDDEEDRTFWKQMRESQISVLGEDIGLFKTMQRAMEQGDISGQLMGFQEQQPYWYHEEIDRRIGVANVPVHMRVKPLLAGFAAEG